MGENCILVRGAGDLATGVALRLYRAGLRVVMTEVSEPLAVRRAVSFSEAVYEGRTAVEGVIARLSGDLAAAAGILPAGEIPVLVDPNLELFQVGSGPLVPKVVVDARLLKLPVPAVRYDFVIGLGPGFTPGENCSVVVETMRGHTLGRVYTDRPALENTGLPEGNPDRVLRAPISGTIRPAFEIRDHVREGQAVAEIEHPTGRTPVFAKVSGVLRGMLRDGMRVQGGLKIGDIDERGDPANCLLVSDKSLAIGGGVLEAVLSQGSTAWSLSRGS